MKRVISILLLCCVFLSSCGNNESKLETVISPSDNTTQLTTIDKNENLKRIRQEIFSATDITFFVDFENEVKQLNEYEKSELTKKGGYFLFSLAFCSYGQYDTSDSYDYLCSAIRTIEYLELDKSENGHLYEKLIQQRDAFKELIPYDGYLTTYGIQADIGEIMSSLSSCITSNNVSGALEQGKKALEYSKTISYEGDAVITKLAYKYLTETCTCMYDLANGFDVYKKTNNKSFMTDAITKIELYNSSLTQFSKDFSSAHGKQVMSYGPIALTSNWEPYD